MDSRNISEIEGIGVGNGVDCGSGKEKSGMIFHVSVINRYRTIY